MEFQELGKKMWSLRKARKKLTVEEERIEQEWKKRWEDDVFSGPSSKGEYFCGWLLANMDFLNKGSEMNREKNFAMKFLALLFLVVSFTVCLGVLQAEDGTIRPINQILLLLPCYIIYKWIIVKKYQETWSRYSAYRSHILQEMTKYIYNISPYNKANRKMIFIEKVMDLTKMNGEKFQKNMEEKEEKLFSFSKIKNMKKL